MTLNNYLCANGRKPEAHRKACVPKRPCPNHEQSDRIQPARRKHWMSLEAPVTLPGVFL